MALQDRHGLWSPKQTSNLQGINARISIARPILLQTHCQTICHAGDHYSPPIGDKCRRFFRMMIGNDQSDAIENLAVELLLSRQPRERVAGAFYLVAGKLSIYYRNVDADGASPNAHLLDDARSSITAVLFIEISPQSLSDVEISHLGVPVAP
nr:hypothetical protein [Bradyrhizobium glycinis]